MVAVDQAERARAVLVEVASAGWSESHAPDGELVFDLWVPSHRAAEIERLRGALLDAAVTAVVRSASESDDWRDGLRRHHQPIEIAGAIRIRPPWADRVEGIPEVVIDPGMAFGTGQHATTRGCLTLMLDLPRGSLLDVGTGSGVLAIAAAKLGHEPVVGIDADALAVEAAVRNAAVNGVRITVEHADATSGPLPTADAIVANITRMHVAALAARLPDTPPKWAVLSGFTLDDVASASGPWQELGYRVRAEVAEDGWAAVALEHAPR